MLTPEQRTLRARIAAYASHASEAANADPAGRTLAARTAFLRRFEDQVDPERRLSEDERIRRALMARKAYMARLAFESSKKRGKPTLRRRTAKMLAAAEAEEATGR